MTAFIARDGALEGQRFELDGDSVDAPAGTFVFARAAVTRTAFAEEAGTTIVAVGATSGKVVAAAAEPEDPVDHIRGIEQRRQRAADAGDEEQAE